MGKRSSKDVLDFIIISYNVNTILSLPGNQATLPKMELKGMVAIVTGGAGGIGTELCKSLISRGVKVGT